MCSIFGYYRLNTNTQVRDDFIEESMRLMEHRGPDAKSFKKYNGVVGLGNHRLSIIDTREISNQPMESKRSVIVFNGEIYNYLELANIHLKKSILKTSSDTEVLQKGLEKFGTKFLNKTNGMFAFAWYDRSTKSLILGRDRFGVKPLHYTIKDGVLYFSSEIKPLVPIIGKPKRNNFVYKRFFEDTATDYDEKTFLEEIFQVKKGEYLKCEGDKISINKWYQGSDYRFDKNIFKNRVETINKFEDLLVDAISKRLRADVPVCMTLSGGLDSTLIYTLIKERIKRNVTLFSYVNDNSRINEIKLVKKITSEYGDKVYIVRNNKVRLVKDIKKSLRSLEFPIWDLSSIAYSETYKKIHEKKFKVVIEGHASDELLGGYPFLLLAAVKEMIKHLNLFKGFMIFKVYMKCELSYAFKGKYPLMEYLSFVRQVLFHKSEKTFQESLDHVFNYQILPIVLRTFDRLTMAHSIESRSPYLDFRVVEYLKALPMNFKVSRIGSKAILREILKKYGKDYIYRNGKKIGFGFDYSKYFSNKTIKKFFKAYIDIFDIDIFAKDKYSALKAIDRRRIRELDFDRIWKVASISYIENYFKISK